MGILFYRRISQWFSALLAHGYVVAFSRGAIYQGGLKGFCVPFLACYACPTAITSCPIGTIQHFMAIGAVPWLVIGGLVMVGAVLGRLTCGWLCPFGLVQDLLYRVPATKMAVPGQLRFVKYAVLIIGVIILPLATKEHWFSQVCPAGTLFAGIPWVIWNPTDGSGQPTLPPLGWLFAVKVSILAALLALFVTTKRPFCRVLCPLGAILSLFGGLSLVRMQVSSSCKRCNQCQKSCPVDHAVWEDPNSGECIRCLACMRCPSVRVALAGASLSTTELSRSASLKPGSTGGGRRRRPRQTAAAAASTRLE